MQNTKITQQDQLQIQSIKVRYGAAIDQVKFCYTDGTNWQYGVSGGQMNNTPFTMTEGEYLIKVISEGLPQQWYAAASIEFMTNKGRIHKYYPKWSFKKKDKNILKCKESKKGYSIVQLRIVGGILEDIIEQKIPEKYQNYNIKDQWYSVFWLEKDEYSHNNIFFKEFKNKNEAKKFYNQGQQKNAGQIFLDVKNNKILKQQGKNQENLEYILEFAKEKGYFLDNIDLSFDGNYFSNIIKYYQYSNFQKSEIPLMIIVIILIVISNFASGYQNIIFGKVIESITTKDSQLQQQQIQQYYISQIICYFTNLFDIMDCSNENDKIISIIATLFSVGLLSTLINCLQTFIQSFVKQNKLLKLKKFFFKHALEQEQGFYDTCSVHEIKDNTNPEIFVKNVCEDLPEFLSLNIKFITFLIMMAYISLELTVCVIVLFPIYGLTVNTFITQKIRSLDLLQTRSKLVGQQSLNEAIENIGTVKLFSQEKEHIRLYVNSYNTIYNLEYKKILFIILEQFCIHMLQPTVFCVALYYGVNELINGRYSQSDLTSYFMIFSQLLQIIQGISHLYKELRYNLLNIEQRNNFAKRKSKLVEGNLNLKNFQQNLEFKNVSFYYPSRPNEWVLKDISFKIQPGKMIAFVGESGSGKSTITNLIMKLYDPLKGKIELDGHDLNDYDIESLHSLISIVNQTPTLFNNTIKFNIQYGVKKETTDEELINVCKQANAYDFIQKSRSGFDTTVGWFSSTQLSGGQKQRIAIARAMLMQPQILILDEATSALDSENERLIQQSLERLMKNKTIVVIAHRLSTVKNADEIICLKNGVIVERGSHDQLIDQNGYYKTLVDKQLLGKTDSE